MMWKNYWEFKKFENFYFEDSYLLSFTHFAELKRVEIDLDVILKEQHENFAPPTRDDQYCYKRGCLVFSGVNNVFWHRYIFFRTEDKNSEYDYGNIDTFIFLENQFQLNGDWGDVVITSEKVELKLR